MVKLDLEQDYLHQFELKAVFLQELEYLMLRLDLNYYHLSLNRRLRPVATPFIAFTFAFVTTSAFIVASASTSTTDFLRRPSSAVAFMVLAYF